MKGANSSILGIQVYVKTPLHNPQSLFYLCLSMEDVVFLFEIFSKIILVFNLEDRMTLCIWDLLVEYPSQNFYCTIFGYVPQDVKKHLPGKEDEDQQKLEICLWHISLVPPQPQIIIDN